MADRIFYTIYRFFEEMHGPGDSAEVAALFTWSFLLSINLGTVWVLFISFAEVPQFLKGHTAYAFGALGAVIAASQYFRYLTGNRIDKMRRAFGAESTAIRSRRRWMSFGYSLGTIAVFSASLWLLSAMR